MLNFGSSPLVSMPCITVELVEPQQLILFSSWPLRTPSSYRSAKFVVKYTGYFHYIVKINTLSMLLSSTKNSICILAGVLSIQSITFIVLSLVDQFTPVYLKSHEFSVTWDWNFDI